MICWLRLRNCNEYFQEFWYWIRFPDDLKNKPKRERIDYELSDKIIIDILKVDDTRGYMLFHGTAQRILGMLVKRFTFDIETHFMAVIERNYYMRIRNVSTIAANELMLVSKDQLPNVINISSPFFSIKDEKITAGFVYNKYVWYMFAGEYYCSVSIEPNIWAKDMKVKRIRDWIKCDNLSTSTTIAANGTDSSDDTTEDESKHEHKPKLVLIIVLCVIIVFVIVIVIVALILMICVKKRKSMKSFDSSEEGVQRVDSPTETKVSIKSEME